MRRPRPLAVAGLAAAVAGGLAAARTIAARRRAMTAVPPELRSPFLLLPVHLNPMLMRLSSAAPMKPTALAAGVTVQRRLVPGRPGDPEVAVFVYEPAGRVRPSGAMLWIHGGGFVLGRADQDHGTASRIAAELGVAVVSVEYRLAPAVPFPGPLEDCYAALAWMHGAADELGVDRRRLAIAGASAGGGLAACLAQLAHDRGEVPVAFQALIYPMLDDRTVLRPDHAGTGTFVWSPVSNRLGWTSYLGHPPRLAAPAPYAAAARRADLAGLPPAWIGVGDVDLFHAEDVEYAGRLRAAGVRCTLDVVPGMYHGANGFFPSVPLIVAFHAAMTDALRAALA